MVATGQSQSTTNRALDRANAIGLDTLDKVTNTSLDSGVELDALVIDKKEHLQTE